MLGDEDDYANAYGTPQWNDDGLIIRISQDTYKITYDPDTSEWWIHNNNVQKRGLGAYEAVKMERNRRFQNIFGENGTIIAAKEGGQLEKENSEFKQWVANGPASSEDAAGVKTDDADEIMGGT